MAFILRWPAILVLLALVLMSAVGAIGATGMDIPSVGVEQVDEQVANAESVAAESGAAGANPIDIGLFAAAAVFFLISAIRLIRRTQGFWTWLLGFACYGGQWAYAQYASGADLVAEISGIRLDTYTQPTALLEGLSSGDPDQRFAAQLALLALVLVVGLFVFIVDAVDRAYWERDA